jgi:hypothetical protein
MRQSRLFPGATLGAALLLILLAAAAEAVELTFELPDNAKECFFQEIDKNTTATLEFQVNFVTLFHFNYNSVKIVLDEFAEVTSNERNIFERVHKECSPLETSRSIIFLTFLGCDLLALGYISTRSIHIQLMSKKLAKYLGQAQ